MFPFLDSPEVLCKQVLRVGEGVLRTDIQYHLPTLDAARDPTLTVDSDSPLNRPSLDRIQRNVVPAVGT